MCQTVPARSVPKPTYPPGGGLVARFSKLTLLTRNDLLMTLRTPAEVHTLTKDGCRMRRYRLFAGDKP